MEYFQALVIACNLMLATPDNEMGDCLIFKDEVGPKVGKHSGVYKNEKDCKQRTEEMEEWLTLRFGLAGTGIKVITSCPKVYPNSKEA